MGIWDDSFSIELKHPLDKEAWKVIEDTELDNTDHIYFTTPSGKRVDFIKADVLDKIRAEITDWQTDIHDNEHDAETHDFVFERIYEILDEYKYRKRG